MRMKSLMTAAEAAGYAMASYDLRSDDDDPVASVRTVRAEPVLPDAVVPRHNALVPVIAETHKSLADALVRNWTSFGALISRRASAGVTRRVTA